MKKALTLSTLLGFAILLSACNNPQLSGSSMVKSEKEVETTTTVDSQVAVEKPTPTLAKDDSIDSIEADLKATTVLEEDFSDIK